MRSEMTLITLILLSIFVVGCSEGSYVNVNPQQFKELIESKDVFVLDVHTPEQEHITSTDVLIPYNEIEADLDQLPKNKNTKIAVYCRSGSMSKEASQTLINMGYENVFNLVGGRNAYVTELGGE